MGRTIAGLGLLLLALPAGAANPGQPPRTSPALRSQAVTFANQLVAFADHVEGLYYRPVKRADLLEAALTGLYEAARQTVPPSLHNDLVQAKSDNDSRAVVIAARERLGDLEELRGPRGLVSAVRGLARALDPYCGIPNPEERYASSRVGQMGLGIEIESDPVNPMPQYVANGDVRVSSPYASKRGPARIVNVLPGGPAQRAGVRPGDLITHINSEELHGPQVPNLLLSLGGASGRFVLTLKRVGRPEPLRVDLTPVQFIPETVFGVARRPDNSWNYLLDSQQRIGYVRVGFIDASTPEEMRFAFRDLQTAGLRGLILDLRGCPGGYITPAVELTGLFLRSKEVATVRAKGIMENRHVTGDNPMIEGVPIMLLVGPETRGGGEMIAAAFQDHRIASVCGQRTFGKGSVQTTDERNPLGIDFKLTTGLFSRPSGKNLHRFPESQLTDDWGVRPDPGLTLPITPDLAEQLKNWLRQQALRPGHERETLPLDEPQNDPQRQFAFRELVKRLK